MHLSEIRDKMTKGLRIDVDLEYLNQQVVDDLEKISKEFHGKTPLRINVTDKSKQINVEMLSRKFNVDASNDFLEKVKRLAEVDCKLVS